MTKKSISSKLLLRRERYQPWTSKFRTSKPSLKSKIKMMTTVMMLRTVRTMTRRQRTLMKKT
jgi:hypothetical protein